MHAAAVGFHVIGADDFVFLIVGPFHKNIRSQSLDQGQGSCFLEDGDKIDGLQSSQHLSASGHRIDRTMRTFEGANAGVAI